MQELAKWFDAECDRIDQHPTYSADYKVHLFAGLCSRLRIQLKLMGISEDAWFHYYENYPRKLVA